MAHASASLDRFNHHVAGDDGLLVALLESVEVAVVACDMEGRLTHINKRALKVMRMDGTPDSATSAWIPQAAPRTPDGRSLTLEGLPLRRALQGDVVADVDLLVRTPAGDRLMSCAARPIRAADGNQLGAVAVFEDVTERRAQEASAREQLSTARRAAQLHSARREGRLSLFAQPIIALDSGESVMLELLLRIRSRRGNIVAPGALLAAAERQGSVSLIDEWVLDQALVIAASGQAVSVNLSADSLGRSAFLELADARITRSGVDPQLLTLEITETAVLADLAGAARFAEHLRSLGCRFALDDFGTGYAPLTYLKTIPFDYIKLDVEFVRDLILNVRSRSVVEGVVAMAGCFCQRTIAEGVEDAPTRGLLLELGVDYAQGFHLGRPAPILDRCA